MKKDLRSVLHSGYTFVRSIEVNKAASAQTLDHFIQEQIKRLKKGETTSFIDAQGDKNGTRPSRWDELDSLERDITEAIKVIKDAGSDSAKLQQIGIFEVGQEEDEFKKFNI